MNKILIIISSLLISVQTYTYACDYISFPYPSCVSAKDKFDEVEYKKCLEVEKEVGDLRTAKNYMWHFYYFSEQGYEIRDNTADEEDIRLMIWKLDRNRCGEW